MSEKTIIECDTASCTEEYEHIGADFLISDITDEGWIYVPESETHYCGKCKPRMIKELAKDGIDYIS